jgi:hypothetical protein
MIANKTAVAYAFKSIPGFSKFGSYTGNNNADGPFVYTGFKPRYVMIKNASSNGYNWTILDTARDSNPLVSGLGANSPLPESSFAGPKYVDMTANGFKIRDGSPTSGYQNFNNSGDTYIYAAFAEQPFGGSNVAPATAR